MTLESINLHVLGVPDLDLLLRPYPLLLLTQNYKFAKTFVPNFFYRRHASRSVHIPNTITFSRIGPV